MQPSLVDDRAIRAEREQRIANWKRPKIAKTVAAVSVVAAGIGVGLSFCEARVLYFEDSLGTTQELIDKNTAKTEELELNLSRSREKMGEACATFLAPYITGGQIANNYDHKVDTKSLEDKAVDDGLREPTYPCSNSASTIRSDFESLAKSSEELKKTREEMNDRLQPEINNIQWELSKGLMNGPWNYIVLGGCALLGLAFAGEAKSSTEYRYYDKISRAAQDLYTQELFDANKKIPNHFIQFTDFKIREGLLNAQAVEQRQ